MKKQMGRADSLGIPFVAIIGETELERDCHSQEHDHRRTV